MRCSVCQETYPMNIRSSSISTSPVTTDRAAHTVVPAVIQPIRDGMSVTNGSDSHTTAAVRTVTPTTRLTVVASCQIEKCSCLWMRYTFAVTTPVIEITVAMAAPTTPTLGMRT